MDETAQEEPNYGETHRILCRESKPNIKPLTLQMMDGEQCADSSRKPQATNQSRASASK